MRCSGPGGQNVNKVNSGVQLRFNVLGCASLPEEARERLIRIAGSRMNKEGEIVLTVQKHRSQTGNRQEALYRLEEMIGEALKKPNPRRPTRIPGGARQRRLDDKRHRSMIKRYRGGASNRTGPADVGPVLLYTVH
jgi:ribosome-associated protein